MLRLSRKPLVGSRSTLRWFSNASKASITMTNFCDFATFANNTAIVDNNAGVHLTYRDLDNASTKLANHISAKLQSSEKGSIGVFNKSSVSFVVSMLATWKVGRSFVPLCTTHSDNELSYIVEDSNVKLICCSTTEHINKTFLGHVAASSIPVLETTKTITTSIGPNSAVVEKNYVATDTNGDGALVIYTSGTTGRPKGVLHTHSSVQHMISSLVQAWQYNERDKILHFLPLYHVHGLANKLLCVLSVGGTVEFLPSAAAPDIWKRLAREEREYQQSRSDLHSTFKPVTLFMAVPTIYARMLEASSAMATSADATQKQMLDDGVHALKRLRLTVCGSAALPDNILLNWKKLTGCMLLERYGMTEIGMGLSNPYIGERRQGYVGLPMPHVQCRLVDDHEQEIKGSNTPGELRIKGPNVFKEYLNRPDATAETFDKDGWFKTGDIAEVAPDGYYKILGRNSSDIIKSSGYKLSALEIERELLAHPQILEAAVVGVPDDILGEKVLAVIALRTNAPPPAHSASLVTLREDSAALREALKGYLADKLAVYKHPRSYVVVDAIPRNHLGKVNKKGLVKDLKLV